MRTTPLFCVPFSLRLSWQTIVFYEHIVKTESIISVLIKDDALVKAGLKPYQAKIDFLGLIEKTVTGSANFQDNVIIFQFVDNLIVNQIISVE